MTCLAVLLLLPAVHAEEGPAEPHDQAAWSPQAPCGKCQPVPKMGAGPSVIPGASPGRWCGWPRAGRLCGFPGQGLHAALLLTLALPPLYLSVPLVPSASCPGRSCSCTRRSSTVGRSCLCARSAGTGHQAGMACRCTSRPSIGGTVLLGAVFPGAILPGPSSGPSCLDCPPQGRTPGPSSLDCPPQARPAATHRGQSAPTCVQSL